jgi:hypothetical protein
MCYHGEIDVAGGQLHVDLLVDQSLAVVVEVLANERHLGRFFYSGFVKKKVEKFLS